MHRMVAQLWGIINQTDAARPFAIGVQQQLGRQVTKSGNNYRPESISTWTKSENGHHETRVKLKNVE